MLLAVQEEGSSSQLSNGQAVRRKLTLGHYSAKEGNFPRVVVRCFIICRVLLINSLTLSALKSLLKFTESSVSEGMLLIFYLKVEEEIVNSAVTYKQAGLPVPAVDLDKSSGWEGISTGVREMPLCHFGVQMLVQTSGLASDRV